MDGSPKLPIFSNWLQNSTYDGLWSKMLLGSLQEPPKSRPRALKKPSTAFKTGGCQRPRVCMDSSGSAHGGLPSGLYTLTSSHPLDLQQIGTRREGKNLRLSQLEPKWQHDPGGSVYQLTHTDSQIYKHISHTLNVILRLNY